MKGRQEVQSTNVRSVGEGEGDIYMHSIQHVGGGVGVGAKVQEGLL